MKEKTLKAVYAVLLLALLRLKNTDPDQTPVKTLAALTEKTRDLAQLLHQIPVITPHKA